MPAKLYWADISRFLQSTAFTITVALVGLGNLVLYVVCAQGGLPVIPGEILLALVPIGVALCSVGLLLWDEPIPPSCPHCLYDLSGLSSEKCPECGNLIARAHAKTRRPWAPAKYYVALGVSLGLAPAVWTLFCVLRS